MKPATVRTRSNRRAHSAGHLNPNGRRVENGVPFGVVEFGDGQHGGKNHRAGVHASECARVVEVERMGERAVQQRRISVIVSLSASDDGCGALSATVSALSRAQAAYAFNKSFATLRMASRKTGIAEEVQRALADIVEHVPGD